METQYLTSNAKPMQMPLALGTVLYVGVGIAMAVQPSQLPTFSTTGSLSNGYVNSTMSIKKKDDFDGLFINKSELTNSIGAYHAGNSTFIDSYNHAKGTEVETIPVTPADIHFFSNNDLKAEVGLTNLYKFDKAYNDQLTKYGDMITIDHQTAYNDFYQMALKLSRLPIIKATTEIIDENSIKFSMRFSNNKLLMVSKSLIDLDDVNHNEVVYSIFENKKRIASDVLDINEFIKNSKELLSL